MNTSVLVPASGPPVEWDTVKQALRLDELQLGEQADNEQNYVMNVLLKSAAQTAQRSLRLLLLDTQLETYATYRDLTRDHGLLTLWLPWGNVSAVDSISYGERDLVAGTDYRVPKDSNGKLLYPGRVYFEAGLFGPCCSGCWGCGPSFDDVAGALLRVQYTAGYGPTAADVPADVQNWLLLRVGTLYANREEITETRSVETLPFVNSLLADGNYRFS